MDGAQFDDLPDVLARAGLAHRSLYRNVQDIELVKAGPWLIDPYHLPDPVANVWGGMPSISDITPAIKADTEAALSETDAASLGDAAYYDEGKTADPVAQLTKVIQMTGDLPAAVFWVGEANLSEPVLWRHLRTINMVLFPKSEIDDIEEVSESMAAAEQTTLSSQSDTHKMVDLVMLTQTCSPRFCRV